MYHPRCVQTLIFFSLWWHDMIVKLFYSYWQVWPEIVLLYTLLDVALQIMKDNCVPFFKKNLPVIFIQPCGKLTWIFFSEYGRYLEDALNSVEPKVFIKMLLVTIHIHVHCSSPWYWIDCMCWQQKELLSYYYISTQIFFSAR